MIKPFYFKVISKDIKEHILERNLMNVINVVKPFQITVISKDIKEHILERILINMINVVKYIHKGEVSKFSELERILMNTIMN
ncbi:hypothetical protein APTSU1_001868500 [Apodemus speciosus]|uniref:Uncharacterized protein n=1 Tax=Apodemus speciosus TaxID=105296 RepID=A0ABQ0FW07_APOSI